MNHYLSIHWHTFMYTIIILIMFAMKILITFTVTMTYFYIHTFTKNICLKSTRISWLVHQLLTLHSTTLSRTSLPGALVVGPLVLPREKYPFKTIQVQRCSPTNAQKIKSAMIALTGGTVFLRFYQKMSD